MGSLHPLAGSTAFFLVIRIRAAYLVAVVTIESELATINANKYV